MRTQEQIVERLRIPRQELGDYLGFGSEVLLQSLEFEHARPFLKEGVTAEQWGEVPVTSTEDMVTSAAEQYMRFAWGKVQDHRGISAERSVIKMTEFVWLLGRDDLLEQLEAAPYEQYGAPKLAVVCRALGWPVPADEATTRMIAGLRCEAGCVEGCGS